MPELYSTMTLQVTTKPVIGVSALKMPIFPIIYTGIYGDIPTIESLSELGLDNKNEAFKVIQTNLGSFQQPRGKKWG